MKAPSKILQAALIWVLVYPCVLIFSYGSDAVAPEAPKWAVVMVSTLFTVSLIEFVGTPMVERVVARWRGQSRAELLADKAEAAEGSAD